MTDSKAPEQRVSDHVGTNQSAGNNIEGSPASESSKIRSSVLAPIEKSFRRNMQDLASLQTMPELMAGFMVALRRMQRIALDNVVAGAVGKINTQVVLERLLDELGAYYISLRDAPSEDSEKLWSEAKAQLEKLSEHSSYGPILTSAIKVLKRAAVLNSWTAFECVATDSWVAVLDENPIPLGHRTLVSIPGKDDSGMSAKHIPVGLAAKHGFDLRHCLGTLLKSKFDFTSMDGIKNAFNAAFRNTKNSEELQAILNKPILRKLEATRNLIVHRAGVVDGEYNRQLSSSLPVGEPLEPTDEQVKEFIDGAKLASGAILIFLDDWLENPDAAQEE